MLLSICGSKRATIVLSSLLVCRLVVFRLYVKCHSTDFSLQTQTHFSQEDESEAELEEVNNSCNLEEQRRIDRKVILVNNMMCGLAKTRDWQTIHSAFTCFPPHIRDPNRTTTTSSPSTSRPALGHLSRLSGGYYPTREEIPSYVKIWAHNGPCGGVIASNRLVITLASCIAVENVSDIIVYTDPNEQYRAEKVCKATTELVVIKLADTLVINNRLRNACIEFARTTRTSAVCLAVSDGYINQGETQFDLNGPRATPMRRVLDCKKSEWKQRPDVVCYEPMGNWTGNACTAELGSPVYCFEYCVGTTRMMAIGLLRLIDAEGCKTGGRVESGYVRFSHRNTSRPLEDAFEECTDD